MATQTQPMTAAELFDLGDDGMRHELVAGELITMVPPGDTHGAVQAQIVASLVAHARSANHGVARGEVGFLIARDPDTVRAPDAAFISRERYEALGPTDRYWPEAPALAVEVISPNDSYSDVQAKVAEWLAAGTVAVLVIDPRQRTAAVHRPGGAVTVHGDGEQLDLGDAVPGWRPRVAELLA